MITIEEYLNQLLKKSTPEKPAWNKEALLEGHSPKWNYIDACMIQAVLAMYGALGDPYYLQFADDFIDFYVDEEGAVKGYDIKELNCDNINGGKNLIALYQLTGKEKYKKALDLLYSQLSVQPRTEHGNFWHKKIYPNQIWLDGLYMVQPFYMEYEMLYNRKENYLDIFRQFENVYTYMRDTKTNLLYHGCDESKTCSWADKKTGCSAHFWSRSLGWYCMALVDTLEKMDEQFFFEYETLQKHLRSVLDALLQVADAETQMFYQVTDAAGRDGNYLETSGSCAIAYALMKGARQGYVPGYYYDYGKRIFDAVSHQKLAEKNGTLVLKDICLVAGLGGMPGKGSYKERDGSYAYYISEPIVEDDAKGVAPFLFAYGEVCRHEKGEKRI